MKYYFIYYGRIALLFFIVCFLYLGLDEFLFVRTAKNNFFESLFYIYLFACLPIVVIIYFSNNAIAKWAEMLHVDYIRLTATEKIIIKWGREREKKGDDNKYQQIPKLTNLDLEKIINKNVK